MKKVLHASDLFEKKKEEKALKPIEFTHWMGVENGWITIEKWKHLGRELNKVVYMGKCKGDGDIFVGYDNYGCIQTFKGYLNDGIIG